VNVLSAENLISLLTLTAMEIVLGIDNIIFLAILSQRLPVAQQQQARRLGLVLALGLRLALLFALTFIMGMSRPLFTVLGLGFSGRNLVLLGGGLFLIAKSAHEIHDKLEGAAEETQAAGGTASFAGTLLQILALDVVFSLDSVITAVGMAAHRWVMVVAMVTAVAVMLVSADKISDFIHRHPTMKILALSFLLLIGALLVAESLGKHVDKGYIYFAMAFAVLVELFNMRVRRKKPPVVLRERYESPPPPK
jgi:predicted tellurium resistance membrane protein TerC